MADETIRDETGRQMQVELDRSREHSARLLDALAQKIACGARYAGLPARSSARHTTCKLSR